MISRNKHKILDFKSNRNIILIGFVFFLGLFSINKYGNAQNVTHGSISNVFMDAMQDVMLDKTEEAFDKFSFVIAHDSLNATAHFQLSKLLFKKGKLTDAIATIEQALSIESNNKWMLDHAGKLYVFDQQYDKAAEIYRELIDKENNPEEYLVKLAYALNQAEKHEETLQVFSELMKYTSEDDVDLLIQQQKIYMKMGNYEEAINIANKLIEFYPHEFEFYVLLASVLEEAGKEEQIISMFEKTDQKFPLEYRLQSLLIREYLKNEQFQNAKKYISDILIERAVNEKDKGKILMTLLLLQEDYAFAREALLENIDPLIQKYPENPEYRIVSGHVFKLADQLPKALLQFKKAIDIDSMNHLAWDEIIKIYIDIKEYDSAIYFAQQAAELFPESILPLYYEAHAHIQKEHLDKAIVLIESAVTNTPAGDTGLLMTFHALLGDIYQENDDFEMAEKNYVKVLNINPNHTNVLNNYSYSLAENNIKLDLAEKMSAKTLQQYPEKAIFLDTYGWILYKQGNFKQARKYMQRAIRHSEEKDLAILYEHLGDIEYKLGKKRSALKQWNSAQEFGGDSDELIKKIKNKSLNE